MTAALAGFLPVLSGSHSKNAFTRWRRIQKEQKKVNSHVSVIKWRHKVGTIHRVGLYGFPCSHIFTIGIEDSPPHPETLFELQYGHWFSEQKSLRLFASLLAQAVALFLRLHAFGDYRKAEAAPEMKNGAHDRRIFRGGTDSLDKAPVYLQARQRITLEQTERGIAGAVIIECDAYASRAKLA